MLACLRDSSTETATLDDLVDYVARPETSPSAPDRESVRIDLYHVHLPVLDDAGAVDFDSRTESVRYRRQPSVETLLDSVFPSHAEEEKIEG